MTMKPLAIIALVDLQDILTGYSLEYNTSMETLPQKGYTSLEHMIQRAY